MKIKSLIIKSNVYDAINDTFWHEDLLRKMVKEKGDGYSFDETDKCVYWEGEVDNFKKKFVEKFPWSIMNKI